jgi:arginase
MKNKKYILPNPFNLGPYGNDDGQAYKKIIHLNGANPNADNFFPSNQLLDNCVVLESIKIPKLNHFEYEGSNIESKELEIASQMIQEVKKSLSKEIENGEFEQLFVIGGDHTVAMGTGAYLSEIIDMSKVGLVWIDAHGDFNTPQTSSSKSLTGYPCAVNLGLGSDVLLQHFKSNFIQKCVQIGVRDIDELESKNLKQKEVKTYSNLDVEDLGMKTIMDQTLDYLKDCEYLWLSLDIDALDSTYIWGKTDVPVVGGLTPREMLYITSRCYQNKNLKVTELVQINNVEDNFTTLALANRLIELSFGLGGFRNNQ